jgi:hypothetical protein
MNNSSKLLIAALAFGGSISTATAGGVITGITASGGVPPGTFSSTINPDTLNLSKTFNSLDPITLNFAVGHTEGGSGTYTVTENITNNTNQDWTDFHITVTEPTTGGQGDVFTSHNQSTLTGFTLDSSSGPRNLDFTGSLAAHSSTTATFNLSPFDPGSNNTTTFTLTQVPTIPEPETYAMLLAGLGLMGAIVRRRNKSNA